MNDKDHPPDDSADRRTAATCFDSNIVVVAGAGTGKTSLLVERVLNVIGSGRVEIEQIAAITFTKKAAGEMRQRVTEGLERLLHLAGGTWSEELDYREEADRAFEYLTGEGGCTTGEIVERSLAALKRMDMATIETIHQFCASILRSQPMEAGIDPSFEIDEGRHGRMLLEELWEEFVGDELGTDAPRIDLWRRLLSRLTLDEIEQVADQLTSFEIPLRILEEPLPTHDARELFKDHEVEELLSTITRILDFNPKMHHSTKKKFHGMHEALSIFHGEGLRELQGFLAGEAKLCTWIENGNYPLRTTRLEGISGDLYEETGRSSFSLLKHLMRIDEELIRSVIEAVAPFAIRFREGYLSQGFIGYDGLLAVTHDLLSSNPEVRDRLKRRYRMLMVDEFQDTDPLQYRIVQFLGEVPGGEAVDPETAELQPGRLFIVGDPKQSIYRFRGADYEAFEKVMERLKNAGGRELYLTRNFRSVPEVLEPINGLFRDDAGGKWHTRHRYQPEYIPITSNRKSAGQPRVEIWTVGEGRKVKADDRRVHEGRAVADGIKRLVLESGSGHEPDYSRITVLLRAFSNLNLYLQAFRDRGIPYVVDGGKGFMERPEVGHLSATLKALLRPADQAALLAFLRSPVGGVTDVDLARFRDAGGSWDWRSDIQSPEDHRSMKAAFDLMKALSSKTRNGTPDEIVRWVLEDTGLSCLSGAAYEGPQRLANLRKIAHTASKMARDGKMSLVEVLETLEDDQTSEIESESPLADETTNAVRVLTIHKAKGLENDIVFVPDLAGGRGNHEQASGGFRRLPDGAETVALKVGGKTNCVQAWFEMEEERHQEAEDLRLLYVAMTRARERLILVTGNQGGRKPWVEALAPWEYDPEHAPGETLNPEVAHRLPEMTGLMGHEATEAIYGAGEAVSQFNSAVEVARSVSVLPFRAPSKHEEENRAARDREDPDTIPFSPPKGGDVARVAGTIVHRAMEHWDGGEDQTLVEAGDGLSKSTTDIDEDDRQDLRREVRSILRAFLGSPLAGEFRKIDIIGRELAMLMNAGDGSVYRGSIDLLYNAPNGDYVVADFKTDDIDDPASLAERYGDQLTIYARAVMQALNLPSMPASEIWHMRSGRIIHLGSSL